MLNKPVICVTPNAALDRTLVIPDFALGKSLRIDPPIVKAGGKGLNVARALQIFQTEAISMGLLGGHSGRLFADLVIQDGLQNHWTWFEGETRTCTLLVTDGVSTQLNEPGLIQSTDWDHLVEDILQKAESASLVCISGSLPRGVPKHAPTDLIEALRGQHTPVWVDTSGASLTHAISACPEVIKVNADEIGGAVNMHVDTPESAAKAARLLLQQGIQMSIVTLGADGAVLVDHSGAYYATAPQVEVVDATASGDSVMAGVVAAYLSGKTPSEMLQYGVAAGTANALFAGGAVFTHQSFHDILQQTTVNRLPD